MFGGDHQVSVSANFSGLPELPAPAAPEHPRQLGDARSYTAADVSERLSHWHAPRVNRWERMRVTAGTLIIEYLRASGISRVRLVAGEQRWFAPGTRWRVADMQGDDRFDLELHADSKGQAEAPQTLRSELLDQAPRVAVPDPGALQRLTGNLPAGAACIVEARFDLRLSSGCLRDDRSLFWHPLQSGPKSFTAFMARSEQAFDLAIYLGRDHAIIEATLGGALAGDAEKSRWLQATLERHLHIEEELIFPAWLEAGGPAAWVRGLKSEHRYLRQYLAELGEPVSRRKFLRLLDGHDEKEERVVYPDILARLGAGADALCVQAAAYPPANPGTPLCAE